MGVEGPPVTVAGPGWPPPDGRGWTFAASYAASLAAFAHAMMDLYWALGGHDLLSTRGGYPERLAHQGGVLPELPALSASAAQMMARLLALALVRAWGQVIPRVLLVLDGGALVLTGTLVLTGAIHPSGRAGWTATRWHTGVRDMWFLVWGILLALASAGYWRRTARAATDPGAAPRTASRRHPSRASCPNGGEKPPVTPARPPPTSTR